MSLPSTLIATAKVRPQDEADFSAWQVRHNKIIAKFPGFISSDIIPTGPTENHTWTIVLNFQTPDQLQVWQKSQERAELIKEAIPFFESGNIGEIVTSKATSGAPPETTVTEVVFSKIKPGMDDQYREWAVRIQSAQSKYPGYRGMYLQPPTNMQEGRWTTLIRYDTVEHLEAWMHAPERAKLLDESQAFIESEELTRLATSFPGWVPIDPMTGKGPPDWKTAALVLLGLFPLVMLELRFVTPIFVSLKLNSSFSTFCTNFINVSLTSFVGMPLFVRCFSWWIFPKEGHYKQMTLRGNIILIGIFLLQIALFWNLLTS